jgi:hypothetical protein
MRFSKKVNMTCWLTIGLLFLSTSACNGFQKAPGTYVVLVTRVVPVTQIIPVQVTRVVRVTQIVRIGDLTAPPPPATVAPATAAPATAAPAVPVPMGTPLPANHDLLVWYDFEGNFPTSGVVPDKSGHGVDAQVVGTVKATAGISAGRAINFFGNGYIQASSNPAAGRNQVTFSLWFKTDTPQNNYKLASGAWWDGGPGSGWIIATHIPEFWSNDTNGVCLPDIINIENHFPADEWNHELVAYDGQHIREYTNGQLVNDWPTSGAAIGNGEPMAIGAWPEFPSFNFQGSIDEFKMFGWGLSSDEVQDIYANGQ